MHHAPTEPGRARFEAPGTPPAEQPPPREITDAKGRPITRRRAKELLRDAAERMGLAPRRFAVLLAVVHFWQQRGIFPLVRTIAKRAKVSTSTAYVCLADLCAAQLLLWSHRRDEHGHNRSSLFWFTDELFRLAGIAPLPPPYSEEWRPRAPKSVDKRDPSLHLDPSSSSGSVDPSDNGDPVHARATSAPAPIPFFVSNDDDPAFVDLARIHLAAHRKKYGPEAERRGETYDPRDAGTIAREHRADVAAELHGLAARALAFAHSRDRYDLTADAIRLKLTARIVRSFLDLDRTYLREHCHPLGCLWGKGGTDGKPSDLLSIAARVFEDWCANLDPGETTHIADVLASAPGDEPPPPAPHEDLEHDPRDEHDQIRAACEELLSRRATVEEARDEPALRAPHRRGAPPTAAQLRDLARIDEQDRREALARARARRALKPRGGRVPTGTRPRARNAFLAALGALAATLARAPDLQEPRPELARVDEHDTARTPPKLRDLRARPGACAPRRRRHGPRWIT